MRFIYTCSEDKLCHSDFLTQLEKLSSFIDHDHELDFDMLQFNNKTFEFDSFFQADSVNAIAKYIDSGTDEKLVVNVVDSKVNVVTIAEAFEERIVQINTVTQFKAFHSTDQSQSKHVTVTFRDYLRQIQEYLLQKANRSITEHADYGSQCEENNYVQSSEYLLHLPSKLTEALVNISSRISLEKETDQKKVPGDSYSAEVSKKNQPEVVSESKREDKLCLSKYCDGAIPVKDPAVEHASKHTMDYALSPVVCGQATDLSPIDPSLIFFAPKLDANRELGFSTFTKQPYIPSAVPAPCSYGKQYVCPQCCTNQPQLFQPNQLCYSTGQLFHPHTDQLSQLCTNQLVCNNCALQGNSPAMPSVQCKPETCRRLPEPKAAFVQIESPKQLLPSSVTQSKCACEVAPYCSEQKSTEADRCSLHLMEKMLISSVDRVCESRDYLNYLVSSCRQLLPFPCTPAIMANTLCMSIKTCTPDLAFQVVEEIPPSDLLANLYLCSLIYQALNVNSDDNIVEKVTPSFQWVAGKHTCSQFITACANSIFTTAGFKYHPQLTHDCNLIHKVELDKSPTVSSRQLLPGNTIPHVTQAHKSVVPCCISQTDTCLLDVTAKQAELTSITDQSCKNSCTSAYSIESGVPVIPAEKASSVGTRASDHKVEIERNPFSPLAMFQWLACNAHSHFFHNICTTGCLCNGIFQGTELDAITHDVDFCYNLVCELFRSSSIHSPKQLLPDSTVPSKTPVHKLVAPFSHQKFTNKCSLDRCLASVSMPCDFLMTSYSPHVLTKVYTSPFYQVPSSVSDRSAEISLIFQWLAGKHSYLIEVSITNSICFFKVDVHLTHISCYNLFCKFFCFEEPVASAQSSKQLLPDFTIQLQPQVHKLELFCSDCKSSLNLVDGWLASMGASYTENSAFLSTLDLAVKILPIILACTCEQALEGVSLPSLLLANVFYRALNSNSPFNVFQQLKNGQFFLTCTGSNVDFLITEVMHVSPFSTSHKKFGLPFVQSPRQLLSDNATPLVPCKLLATYSDQRSSQEKLVCLLSMIGRSFASLGMMHEDSYSALAHEKYRKAGTKQMLACDIQLMNISVSSPLPAEASNITSELTQSALPADSPMPYAFPVCTCNENIVSLTTSVVCSQALMLLVVSHGFRVRCILEIAVSGASDSVVISAISDNGFHVMLYCISKLGLFYFLPSHPWDIHVYYMHFSQEDKLQSLLCNIHTVIQTPTTPFMCSHSPLSALEAQGTESEPHPHLSPESSSVSNVQFQFSQQSSEEHQSGITCQDQGNQQHSQTGCNSSGSGNQGSSNGHGNSSNQSTSDGKSDHQQDGTNAGHGNERDDGDDDNDRSRKKSTAKTSRHISKGHLIMVLLLFLIICLFCIPASCSIRKFAQPSPQNDHQESEVHGHNYIDEFAQPSALLQPLNYSTGIYTDYQGQICYMYTSVPLMVLVITALFLLCGHNNCSSSGNQGGSGGHGDDINRNASDNRSDHHQRNGTNAGGGNERGDGDDDDDTARKHLTTNISWHTLKRHLLCISYLFLSISTSYINELAWPSSSLLQCFKFSTSTDHPESEVPIYGCMNEFVHQSFQQCFDCSTPTDCQESKVQVHSYIDEFAQPSLLEPLNYSTGIYTNCQGSEVQIQFTPVPLMLSLMFAYAFALYKMQNGFPKINGSRFWYLFLSLAIILQHTGISILLFFVVVIIPLFLLFVFSRDQYESSFDPGGSNNNKQSRPRKGAFSKDGTHNLEQADVNLLLDSEGSVMVTLCYSFVQDTCSSMRCGNARVCKEVSVPNIRNSMLVTLDGRAFLQKYRPSTFALPSSVPTAAPTSMLQPVKSFNDNVEACNIPLVQDSLSAPSQDMVIVKQTESIIHSSPILSSSASSYVVHFTSPAEDSTYLPKLSHPSLTHEERQEHHDDLTHSAFVSNSTVHPPTNYLRSLGQIGRNNIDSSSAPSYKHNFIIPHEVEYQRGGNMNQSCAHATQELPSYQDHRVLNDTPAAASANSTTCTIDPMFSSRSMRKTFKWLLFIIILLLSCIPSCGQAQAISEVSRPDIPLMLNNASSVAAHESFVLDIANDNVTCSTTALHGLADAPTVCEMKHVPSVFVFQLTLRHPFSLLRQTHPYERIGTQKKKPTNNTAMMVHPEFSLSSCKDLTVVPMREIVTCESISPLNDCPPDIGMLLSVVMLDRYAKGQDYRQCLPSSHHQIIPQCTLVYHREEMSSRCPVQEYNTALRFELTFSVTPKELNDTPTLIELIGILIFTILFYILILPWNKLVRCVVLSWKKLVRCLVGDDPSDEHEREQLQRPIQEGGPVIYDRCPRPHQQHNIIHRASGRNRDIHGSKSVLVEPYHDDLLVGPDYPSSLSTICK